MITARIFITLKEGILDPQGKTVHHALANLGLTEIDDVRIGKLVQFRFASNSRAEAQKMCEQACGKLLANPVIEDYKIEYIEGS